jgi:hypothetical protein
LFALGLAIGYHHSRRLSLGLAIGIANLAVGVIVISVEATAAH